MKKKIVLALVLASSVSSVHAGILTVDETDFNAGAGLISFSEFPSGTVNPTYTPALYGGDATDPDVFFGGLFTGQSLSTTPAIDCPGGAATACVVGAPVGGLSLDSSSPQTFITPDTSTSRPDVLSGTPLFNGPIAILFSSDQLGVGFDGGFFDAVGSTAITAFARDGSLIGSVVNTIIGIEFLGLVTDNGSESIAGVFLDLVGPEPAGFAVDNIRFGQVGDIDVPTIPEPSTLAALCIGLAGFGFLKGKSNKSIGGGQ